MRLIVLSNDPRSHAGPRAPDWNRRARSQRWLRRLVRPSGVTGFWPSVIVRLSGAPEGSKRIAQGKAAEAAALGKTPPHPTTFFPSGLARPGRAKPEGRKPDFILSRSPRVAPESIRDCPGLEYFALPGHWSLAHSARPVAERPS
jgi:hypothetical protein